MMMLHNYPTGHSLKLSEIKNWLVQQKPLAINVLRFIGLMLLVALFAVVISMATQGVPMLLNFLSRHISEVKLGLWLIVGAAIVSLLTLLYIITRKD